MLGDSRFCRPFHNPAATRTGTASPPLPSQLSRRGVFAGPRPEFHPNGETRVSKGLAHSNPNAPQNSSTRPNLNGPAWAIAASETSSVPVVKRSMADDGLGSRRTSVFGHGGNTRQSGFIPASSSRRLSDVSHHHHRSYRRILRWRYQDRFTYNAAASLCDGFQTISYATRPKGACPLSPHHGTFTHVRQTRSE